MAVFHPLKHTLARRERGIAEREKGEKTERGDSRRSASSSQTHFSSSHPYLSVSRRSPCRQGALGEQVEVVYSHTHFFFPSFPSLPFPPVLMRSYLALSYSHRLGEIETALWGHSKDITQAALASERGLVVSFCRGLN